MTPHELFEKIVLGGTLLWRKILYAGTNKKKFSGWWQTLPYDERIKSVGKIRTDLIRTGKLKFEDLVDKKTGKYFTLAE